MPQMTNTPDELASELVIVGGGMVGLSLALLAHQALPDDMRITVLDRYPLNITEPLHQPSFDARSTAISNNSIAIFERLNLWSRIAEHATEITQVHVTDRGHLGTTAFAKNENQGEPLGFVADNHWLGQCLAASVHQAKNIDVICPATAQAIRFNEHGAVLSIEKHDQNDSLTQLEISCELIAIVDGAQSQLRGQLGIAIDEHDYHQAAVIANVEFEHAHGGVAYERFTPAGPLALLPLGESANARQSALVWTTPEDRLEEVLAWDDATFLKNLQQAYGYRLGRFVKVGERNHYPLKRIIAREQVRSSIALMGNAAHYLHPVAGQGFNLALRDCEKLVQQLQAQHEAGQSLGQLQGLLNYVDSQQTDQWLTTEISHSFNSLFSNPRFVAQASRNIGLLSMGLFKPVKHAFFNQMMGKSFAG